MNVSDPNSPAGEPAAGYSVEILSVMTGVSVEVILEYQEHGIIVPPGGCDGFDDETVRTLRRLDHLRHACELNYRGLKMMAALLAEVESLRRELAARR